MILRKRRLMEEKRMPILISIPHCEVFHMIYLRRSAQLKAMVTSLGLVGSGVYFLHECLKTHRYIGRRNVHFQITYCVWCWQDFIR